VLVYGDTNATLAGALAGAQAGVRVAHVEAGMRSFDRSMPEELNRVLTDHASTLLLCPSTSAADNLRREGVSGAVEIVGDVMVDVAAAVQPRARERLDLLEPYEIKPKEYVVATAHRAGNVDDPHRLAKLVELLLAVPMTVVAALHPRTRKHLERSGLTRRLEMAEHVRLAPPLGYVELAALVCNARAVLTDSGGLQKEAYLAGTPCITLRSTTEWTETLEHGWNVVVDLDRDRALAALSREPPAERPALYGDAQAGDRVVAALAARPAGFEPHPKLERILAGERDAYAQGNVDWTIAEALALGTLLLEGTPVRLAGHRARDTRLVAASRGAASAMQPWIAEAGGAKQLVEFEKKYPETIAFYNFREEYDFLSRCARSSSGNKLRLWGLDQELMGASGLILDRILDTHPGKQAAEETKLLLQKNDESHAAAVKSGPHPG